jgi:hypothetical protein
LIHIFTFKQSGHSNALCPVRPTQTAFGSGGWPRSLLLATLPTARLLPHERSLPMDIHQVLECIEVAFQLL